MSSISLPLVLSPFQMPLYAFRRLCEVFGDLKEKSITFLGISYRGDVGDTRFSPVHTLVNLIREQTDRIQLHDSFVSYWEEQDCVVESDLFRILDLDTDLVIISAGHSEYKTKDTLNKLMMMKPMFIYDSIGLFSPSELKELRGKHKVSVLGCGNIN